jgi:signal peptidase II
MAFFWEENMFYALFMITIVALDQLTKFLILRSFVPNQSVELVPGILNLTFTRNTGAAFSILRDKQLLLIGFTFLVICFLLGLLYRQFRTGGSLLLLISLTMIIGGAIGNLVDRMRFNYVVDFFEFTFVNFAVFNVADIFITFGTIALMVYVVIDGKGIPG